MTAILLERPARPNRLGMSGITTAIKIPRLPKNSGRYLVGSLRLREQFERGNVASRPQEFARGFVDFLMGRAARNSR